MELILSIDYFLFELINQELTHPYLNGFFIFWTDFQKSPVFYFFILPLLLVLIFWRQRWKGLGLFSLSLFVVGVTDLINSKLIKPIFDRPRPLDAEPSISEEVILRIPDVGGPSFPSSHAVDAFCLVAFISYFHPRLFLPLGALATLTAYSRVYSGVHFPSDVLFGALVGLVLGFSFAYLKRLIKYLVLVLFCFNAHGMQDPTGGKPFLPWLWQDQFKPTLEASIEKSNLYVFGGGSLLTAVSFSEDENSKELATQVITEEQAQIGSKIGGGPPLIGIAILQMFFDQKEGLAHARAITLTAFSHITIAVAAQRERPNNSPTRLSFPSGHVSHTFTSATSLAYSYGPWVGTLAFTGATWNALSRLREEAHWLSDIVAGATLGIFWGRASAMANRSEKLDYSIVPLPLDGGAGIMYSKDF